ncbi:hypothetical protein [Rhizobium leguminosarum]|uniref:hypothetical protein n=1 Tax=Rhizobium leguminosarum TaxID=384 RepID=UPI000B92B5B6|nr:hypothetical protein [Rhizobium leguminosarum]ASS56459.1 hypothetical protein CHR56_18920 [Rhizobium leguminosarum bv. viciae]TAV52919.1 hypothetical protein ELI29_07325 [Rhizobium leguminosarum]WSH63654.1 hypothetical protein U8Q05_18650 [Rhizobium ruizarguesonis]
MEPLAVYELASNASEVCDAILEKIGGTRIKKNIAEMQGWNVKDVNVLINAPRNFAKHADRDHLAEIEDVTFDDCSALILTACVDYSIAAKRSPSVVGAFIAWFAAANPEKTGSFFSEAAHEMFPGLAAMSHSEQIIAGRRYLVKPLPSDVLNATRNELSDDWRWRELRRYGQDFRSE